MRRSFGMLEDDFLCVSLEKRLWTLLIYGVKIQGRAPLKPAEISRLKLTPSSYPFLFGHENTGYPYITPFISRSAKRGSHFGKIVFVKGGLLDQFGSPGVMKWYPFWGASNLMLSNVAGNFEGIYPTQIVHCLGWYYNDPWWRVLDGIKSRLKTKCF